MNQILIILVYVALFGAFIYFFMVRPNRRRQAEQEAMVTKMTPGTRVLLTDGMFGTLRAMGDRQAVVELAPGVDVTVMRQAIARILNPDEEEFEYEDAAESASTEPGSEEGSATFEPPEGTESAGELDGAARPTAPSADAEIPPEPEPEPERPAAADRDSAEFWSDMERRMQTPHNQTTDDRSDQR